MIPDPYASLRFECWKAGNRSVSVFCWASNKYNAEREASRELRCCQTQVRSAPAPIAIHELRDELEGARVA